MKLEIGKEYTLQGFPEAKAKVISKVNRQEEYYWVETTFKGNNAVYMYHPDGCMSGTCGGNYTLKEIPLIKEVWFNVYNFTGQELRFGEPYPSKEESIKACGADKAVGRMKIVLEEGRFDE